MTNEQREILTRINKYAENVLGNIDPQQTPVSLQLQKLRPIMEEIAKEQNISIEDMFIQYMDLQSEASCATEAKLREDLHDINGDGSSPMLFRY